MQITITITNPTSNVLAALAEGVKPDNSSLCGMIGTLMGILDTKDSEQPETAADAAKSSGPTQPPVEQPETAHDADHAVDFLDDVHWMDDVHWKGQKFEFDGVVERITDDMGPNDKRVFIRRADNGKLVSLTNDDLRIGSLNQLL